MFELDIKSRKMAQAVLDKLVAGHAAKWGKPAFGAFLWDATYKQVEEDVVTCSEAEFNSVCRQWRGYMSDCGNGYAIVKSTIKAGE